MVLLRTVIMIVWRLLAGSGSIVGHASSGQLLSDRSTQLLRVAVADVALRSRMLSPSHFIEYLTTARVHLYFDGTSSEKQRYFAFLALFARFASGRRR